MPGEPKKPGELLRERLKRRDEQALEHKKKPTPSERRSKMLRKKLSRGSNIAKVVVDDCNGCKEAVTCKLNLSRCGVQKAFGRCHQCGKEYLHRVEPAWEFAYCTPCYISRVNDKRQPK